MKSFKIGIITPYKREYEILKQYNPEHEIIWLRREEHIQGAHFNVILKGYGWQECDPILLDIYKTRIYNGDFN